MRLKLAAAFDLIVTVAAGAVVGRYGYFWCADQITTLQRVARTLGAFLMGTGLAGVVVLIVDAIRSRGRGRPWGVGRWVWWLSAMYLALAGVQTAIEAPVIRRQMYGDSTDLDTLLSLMYEKTEYGLYRLGLFLVAFLLARRMARPSRDTVLDGQERWGRIYGGLLIAWWIASSTISMHITFNLVFGNIRDYFSQ